MSEFRPYSSYGTSQRCRRTLG